MITHRIERAKGQAAYVQGYTHVLITSIPGQAPYYQSFRSESAAKRAKTLAEKLTDNSWHG
jgi:hypothetical protein